MGLTAEFAKGLWKENPIFRLVLGMCPALAVTTAAINGIAMGLATTFVLISSNLVVSLIRNLIPGRVRLPAFIVIIASFVTIVDLVMAGFLFQLHKTLGVFIPLIVVNCVILGRAEAFATALGSVREVLGNGTLFSIPLLGASFLPFLVMVLPPGAFIALGFLLAAMNRMGERS